MYSSIVDGIGNTPLLSLRTLSAGNDPNAARIWVKLENRNPGGSIKDRIALHMIDRAMERGTLRQGGVIVEPTSGNTGVGLAVVAAIRGLRCILTMPESMSQERRTLLAAFGAELVLTPAKEGMAGAVNRAKELAGTMPHAFMPDQFSNPDVVDAHYQSTGPEIFAALEGQVHALVAGTGTGGTLTGAGLYVRQHYAGVELHAVEPAESPLLSTGTAGPHAIQGIGPNFVPAILRRDILTSVLTVPGEEAMQMTRRLFVEEGLNCGISSGANVCAALQLAAMPHMRGKNIVTFICDTGERYLSTKLFASGI